MAFPAQTLFEESEFQPQLSIDPDDPFISIAVPSEDELNQKIIELRNNNIFTYPDNTDISHKGSNTTIRVSVKHQLFEVSTTTADSNPSVFKIINQAQFLTIKK